MAVGQRVAKAEVGPWSSTTRKGPKMAEGWPVVEQVEEARDPRTGDRRKQSNHPHIFKSRK